MRRRRWSNPWTLVSAAADRRKHRHSSKRRNRKMMTMTT
jgi:hypothetical protein